MIRSIAFIHTVALLVERFRPRFQSELPQQRCFHMLDDPGWLVHFPERFVRQAPPSMGQ